MAFVNSSSTSSSCIKHSRGSSLELQPAPLRLPSRKVDANFDGSKSEDQKDISPEPIVKAPSQRRLPAPKLGSLVSKFEILDAVNNVENSFASRSKESKIPRTQKGLGASLRTTSADKSSSIEESGYVSPSQAVSPPLRGKSKLPVSTLWKPAVGVSRLCKESSVTAVEEKQKLSKNGLSREISSKTKRPPGSDPSLIADRRRVFEHEGSYYPFPKPIDSNSKQSDTQRSMPHLAGSYISGSVSSRQESPTKPQAISPASHEQASSSSGQECSLTEQSPAEKQRLPSISRIPVRKERRSVADLRKSFEKGSQPEVAPSEPIPLLRTTKLMGDNIESVKEGSIQHTTNEPSEHLLLARDSTDTIRHIPKHSLPKSSLFRKGNVHNLDGAVSLGHDDAIADAILPRSQDDALPHVIHPFLSANSIGGFRKKSEEPRTPPKVVTAGKKPLRCAKKVSDLRRLFKRTPSRDASPFRSFWQIRTRNKSKVETEPIMEVPLPNKIPELTTTISTDDFSCDFTIPDVLGNASSIKHKARFDIELDENLPAEQDYPVKGRIRQFERLEHGSDLSRTSVSESYNADVNYSPSGKENERTQKSRGGWHPFRQQSIELWRRISNSLLRSTGEEQAGPSNQADFDDTWSSSFCRRLRYRRSDIFSYQAYRSSEAVRSPGASSYGKSSASIDDDLIAQIESQPPHLTYRQSPSLSKTFPFLARVSDSLGGTDEFDGFGFDGSLLSKATRYRTGSATKKLPQPPASPTPRGDPNALSRVLSQQTVAERKRRRLEEKQLRREEKDKKREEKAKSKGKEKVTDQVGTTKKGKEIERKKESSWSKKTASGFVVRQINDVKLRHPKPRRPGQVKKLVNMYKEKASSGIKLGRGGGGGSG
ncbi:hypothetical protein F5Y02DRAFT_414915 [Annulohypoxylon stygium]|nr:hypothetical protein F5Y02DRAFT_414915 [Annulohypoxylon stygium]